MKLEREVKQSSEMVDRRENEASSDQMKAEELIELPALSEPVCKKILPIKPVHKKPPFPEVPSSY